MLSARALTLSPFVADAYRRLCWADAISCGARFFLGRCVAFVVFATEKSNHYPTNYVREYVHRVWFCGLGNDKRRRNKVQCSPNVLYAFLSFSSHVAKWLMEFESIHWIDAANKSWANSVERMAHLLIITIHLNSPAHEWCRFLGIISCFCLCQVIAFFSVNSLDDEWKSLETTFYTEAVIARNGCPLISYYSFWPRVWKDIVFIRNYSVPLVSECMRV